MVVYLGGGGASGADLVGDLPENELLENPDGDRLRNPPPKPPPELLPEPPPLLGILFTLSL